jgi:hypothetical protein
MPPKRRLIFNGIYCVIAQKTVSIVTGAVLTLDPTRNIIDVAFGAANQLHETEPLLKSLYLL